MQAAEPSAADARLTRAACAAAVLVLTVGYAWQANRAYGAAIAEARGRGMELVVAGPGDLTIRDIPKALEIASASGRLLGDPHFAGETSWYPFVTPAIAAAVSTTLGVPINQAYLLTGILLSAALMASFGALLYSYANALGVLMLPVAVLLGAAWPDNGMYPFSTARVPLTLFMALAGAVLAPRERGDRATTRWSLHAALGLAAGVLALWQGSYFVTATVVVAWLVAVEGVRAVRAPAERGGALARSALAVAGIAGMLAVLVVPQLLRYGTLVQSDTARHWRGGAYAEEVLRAPLWTLPLAPRGEDALWLAAFAACFVVLGAARRRAIPLVVAFAFAQAMAHLGVFLDDPAHPGLAAAAATLLVAPPHTFVSASEAVLTLMKLWVLAGVAQRAVEAAGRRGRLSAWTARLPAWMGPGRLAAAAMLPLTAAALLLSPPQAKLFAQAVDSRWVRFAEEASRRVEPGVAVLGAAPVICFAPLKLLSLPYPAHANPYVGPERAVAEEVLVRAASAGDRAVAGEILRRYGVRYSMGASAVSELCGEAVVMPGPGGMPLVRLRPGCEP